VVDAAVSSNAPLVSVVLPVRDGALFVHRAIASIKTQTLSAWELVIVDDGSADATAEIVTAIGRDDQRVRLLKSCSPGIVGALNTGIDAAHGRLIARMDADDEALPQRLADQVEWLERNPEIGLASCLVEFGGDRNARAGYALHVDWINSLVTEDEISLNRFVESPLAHPSVMFRRELLAEHGGYHPGDFPEDYELWLRWLDAGVRMTKVPRVLLRWNDSPQRLSRRDPRYDPEAFFRVKARWIAREVARSRRERKLWVWGAGRPTRKRAEWLEAAGAGICGYIDIDARKRTSAIGGTGRPVIAPIELPSPREAFVLGYVSSRGARELIRAELRSRGFREGSDFLMCA
jgi:glycosyltransferase involved in cell wall biosynthesis